MTVARINIDGTAVRERLTLAAVMSPRITKYIPHVPTAHQQAFLWLNCRDALYGGAAGGGKSDGLLMAGLQYVDIPGYNALLVRDTYQNLIKPEGLLSRAHEWLAATDAEWDGDAKAYVFPSKATLSFGHMEEPRSHFNYQGPAYQFVGFDEAVGIREHQARFLFSRLRKLSAAGYLALLTNLFPKMTAATKAKYLELYQGIPLRRRCGSNPPTREQIARGKWVKERYISAATRPAGVVFIPAKMDDNPHLDRESYRGSLSELDAITRRQMEDGDWEISAKGNLVDRVNFIVIPEAPKNVVKTVRAWDMAATEPSKDSKDPDWTCGVRMSRTDDRRIVVEHVLRFRKNPAPTEATLAATAAADGTGVAIRMEQEGGSSGKTVIDYYQRRVFLGWDFKGKSPHKNKVQRFVPFANQIEAKNVYVVAGPWLNEFFDELELFPDGAHDDIADACSQAFEELALAPIVRVREVNTGGDEYTRLREQQARDAENADAGAAGAIVDDEDVDWEAVAEANARRIYGDAVVTNWSEAVMRGIE